MTEEITAKFKSWAILELLGHRKLAGLVSEATLFGVGMIRIDVPKPDGLEFTTQHYSPSALYCLSPCTEVVARAFAVRNQPQPVSPWDLRTLPTEQDSATAKYYNDLSNAENERLGRVSLALKFPNDVTEILEDDDDTEDGDLQDLEPEKAIEPGTPVDARIEAPNDPDLPF